MAKTFSARDRNVPVRFGKWSTAEDAYLEQLVELFTAGLLADLPCKTSMRAWLAQMLNCCPMRISKKQMHGRHFVGKAKYHKNNAKIERLTQEQYEQRSHDVWRLRAEFLKAWAKDEYVRGNLKPRTLTFEAWYLKVLELVPTPIIARGTRLRECHKRPHLEAFSELKSEMSESYKHRRVESKVEPKLEVKAETIQQQEKQVLQKETAVVHPAAMTFTSCEMKLNPASIVPSPAIVPLSPAVIPSSPMLLSPPPAMTVTQTSFDDSVSMGDWLLTPSRTSASVTQWNELQNLSRETETRYALREDSVELSVMADQQNPAAGLSIMRRSSTLLIDFGAPSCWLTGEEPKRTSILDSSQWSDYDLADELTMLTEPGLLGWDEMSPNSLLTYNPRLDPL
ncbi:hypothetical protein BBO99_00008750 [Phytophthora kernoviae]|uniref:Uncharacterized protein n=2 Tax=Phytophthora kernoviae TaxID=325452 RepID=A0A3R7J5B1_9STRA|nr:hypothetical protein G195_010224 [Phytophthora kernoviae 00238/432]KAG2523159.1 hypothetical protein JM16_005426 [Phytophthora kernoviae]RLN25936.1 hypothetical protein BBI17_005839 [Phytophthora kernoviae]RLN74776.1 hypothetical protein BBO99_00008750 [Phytophthora kernoviae]